ncbi:DNA mismatch repair endonuclease MutL [Bacillus sp. H-16]|uniref:DNA mismatch repair endonuclease MutL n=1 Tax=Alteribacter salitolerans TaxID=2912333 RepID=UPI00196354D6|nr:DNA mismatch repair endonuclease MutL [Alteribacter salitolerans]MBM7094261.1 DNA mismatch repair endonuclease MutL [Alteribacter salitolerans]
MGIIRKLDDQLSNKIAAGEVVERPASVVKELVENAIDADSTQIRVDLSEGGLASIRVLDNGKGIEEDDLETAFFRHATSKIKNDRDLFHISTLGFRGEALPSIASVSHLTLTTSTGEGEGRFISFQGGKTTDKGKAPARKGTEVTVENLFFNTPARLKYLRTIHTELGHTTDVINRLALAHPGISFELYHNEKTLIKTNGNNDRLRVIASIYGTEVAKNMLKIEASSLDFSVEGYIAKPEITRSNRSYISLLINGRFVKNFAVSRAIHEGYHTLLPVGRHPVVVLSVTMDPILIDVNVHPSKLEVRLSKEQELTELIAETIKDTFKKTTLIPDVKKTPARKQKSEQVPLRFSGAAKNPVMKSHQEEVSDKPVIRNDEEPKPEPETETLLEPLEPKRQEPEPHPAEPQITTPEVKIQAEQVRETVSGHAEETKAKEDADGLMPTLYPIGQLHGTYIMAQNDEGLYIIDQHAAQERIKYEYFREKVGEVDPRLQDLLVPLTFEFTQKEESLILANEDSLRAVGVILEPFGQRTYLLRAHPVWLPKGEEESLLREMIDLVIDGKAVDVAKMREEAAILMSCKAAIKANRYLRQDEMYKLLETLRTCEEPYTCPHGRPIVLHFSTYEMERMFKRIM